LTVVGLIVINQMTVLVKQSFYFQNFLQFCERPSVAVVPVFMTLVFSDEYGKMLSEGNTDCLDGLF